MGKVQRYNNGMYQWYMWHEMCIGGQRRKWSEWWNEEVGRALAEKRRAFGGMATEKRHGYL